MSILFDILRGNSDGSHVVPYVAARIAAGRSSMAKDGYNTGEGPERATQSTTGAPLRQYKGGVCYFMPVTISHGTKKWEMGDAIVSISGKKTIVETSVVGRKGTVKELVSIDDYEIKLTAILTNNNGDYPEQEMHELVNLWEINESVKLSCALTDYFLKEDDSVVITSIEPESHEAMEDMQVVSITMVSDSPFELELK